MLLSRLLAFTETRVRGLLTNSLSELIGRRRRRIPKYFDVLGDLIAIPMLT